MSRDPKQPNDSGVGIPPAEREDVSFRAILFFTLGLTVLVAVAGVAMYGLTVFLRDAQIAQDPPPPALPEARRPHEPPDPRLQSDPIREMDALRAEEQAELASYGWVDQAAGIARVPIDRAMDLLAEDGLAATPDPPLGGATPSTTAAEETPE